MIQQIEDLKLIKLLGKGSYGEVYLSKKLNSNKLYATKKINKTIADTEMRRYFKYEINILKMLNHPNIVKLEEVKTDKNYYYIVMEYINGGELSDYLKKYKLKYQRAFPEEIVQYLMRQIIKALIYIHDRNIIHRDLKLENIMVSFDSERDKEELNMMKAKIKIIDFGFAILLRNEYSLTNSAVGTFLYMDPKILQEFNQKALVDKSRGYGKEVDIWSLGCICYGLYRGKYPFEAKNFEELIGKINYGKYKLPKTASHEIYSFLEKMLQYDGKARLSARELINQPFLTKDPKNFTKIDIGPDAKPVKKEINDINLYKYDGDSTKTNNTSENPKKEEGKTKTFDKNNNYSGGFPLFSQSKPLTFNPQVPSGALQSTTNTRFQPSLQPISVPFQQNIQPPIQVPMQMPVQQAYQQPIQQAYQQPLQQSYQQTYQVPIQQNFQQSLQQNFQPGSYVGGIPNYGVMQNQSQFMPQRPTLNDLNAFL